MPHSSTEIYTSGSYGITLNDIASVIGGSQDLGTLCTSNNINMWAKYKPVRCSGPDLGSDWPSAWDGSYGISPNSIGLNSLLSNTTGGLNGWSYEGPRGGNEWYCILYFNGYNHSSPHPWSGWTGPIQDQMVGATIGFGLDGVSSNLGYNITSNNIKLYNGYLSNNYFGVAIFKNGALMGAYRSLSTMGSSGGDEVEIDTTGWLTGDYVAAPFFWSTDSAGADPESSGTHYTVPFTSPINFRMVSSSSQVVIWNTGNWAGVDDTYNNTWEIGIGPIIKLDGSWRYRLDRNSTIPAIRVTIKASGSSEVTEVYNSNDDSNFTPTDISGDGNTWNIVGELSDCPGTITKPALPDSGYYEMTIELALFCYTSNQWVYVTDTTSQIKPA